LKAIIQRHCTPFLTAAVAAGGLAVATSTLAPAARKPYLYTMILPVLLHNFLFTVTVQSVLFDGKLQAFAVGAVGPQSVFK
jgi:hypothetical protein